MRSASGLWRAVGAIIVLSAVAAPLVGCGGSSGVTGNSIVALLTDLGDDDFAVGTLRGSVLRGNPNARLVSISQQVPSFSVREGAYWLQQAASQYPAGTVFLGIVDPLIGTAGDSWIVATTQRGLIFCGPDNGLLGWAIEDSGVVQVYTLSQPGLVAPGAWDQPPSKSRDLNDILAYAAGQLSAGASPSLAGPVQPTWTKLALTTPTLTGTTLSGEVVHVDHFGNLTTNITDELSQQAGLTLGQALTITVGSKTVPATYAHTYADVPQGEYLVFSDDGYLQVAINLGNASTGLSAKAGTGISIQK